MGRYEMIVAIVAIVMFASVLRARYSFRHTRSDADSTPGVESSETQRLRNEVKQLQERIKVLERITVEKENSLSAQIEELRDR